MLSTSTAPAVEVKPVNPRLLLKALFYW